MNAFLVKVNKKSIYDKIKKKKWKKRIQHKMTVKDSFLIISNLIYCKKDFFIISIKPVILSEQISIRTSPMKLSIVNK